MKKSSLLFSCLAALILMILSGYSAYAQTRNTSIGDSIRSLSPDSELPVIIYMSDKATNVSISVKGKGLRTAEIVKALRQKAASSQAPLKSFLQQKNAKKMKDLWIINGIATVVPVSMIPELEQFPGVERIEQDYVVHAPAVKYGSAALPESNLEAIKAPEVWSLGQTGAGVVVASIDTGVDIHHPDLQGRWRGGSNSWYDPNGQHSTPYDADGHGTMTTGVMVGGSSGGTAIGVAPDAKWIAVKIFNDRGDSTTSNIHEGFQWLLDPDGNPATDDSPDVVNASWGLVDSTGKCVLSFADDIQNLKAAGIAVVFAAGNEGSPVPPMSNTSDSPANNPGSFAVGAVDSNNVVASFSSRGPSACGGGIFPHVVAPGVDIRTSDLTAGGVLPNSYSYVSGTSFSSPHVAGAFALLRGAYPEKTVEEIEMALEQSATDLGMPESDNSYGFGLINILDAYNTLLANNTASPKIIVLPQSYDFGSTEAGMTGSPASFLFTNKGSADLLVAQASIGGINANEFKMLTDGCSGMTIGPQQSCAVEIAFSPASAGTKRAALSVSSNDPVAPALSVALIGTGTLPQSLTVLSPNGNENWTTGIAQTIQWTYSGNPGKYVKVELLKGGVLTRTIRSRTLSGKGSFTWTIPAKQNLGDDYRVRVRSISNNVYSDTSDADFQIVAPPPPSIVVTAPNGGEVWPRGSSQTVGWTYAGKAGAYVKIQLFRGGVLNRTISPSVKIGSNGSGAFTWIVPSSLSSGDTYQVKVVSKSKGSVSDVSNSTFVVE